MTKIKKAAVSMLIGAVSVFAVPGIANAQTVYYKGAAVQWDHGRYLKLGKAYSHVYSSVYSHSATVNGNYASAKKQQWAKASKYVAPWSTAHAYWNCWG
ncbi:MAG: hypothetical protein J6M18_02260 [Actinomycetaceae bacterium]|nr:hypothetical protein [Actinomycetaceae bacterium]